MQQSASNQIRQQMQTNLHLLDHKLKCIQINKKNYFQRFAYFNYLFFHRRMLSSDDIEETIKKELDTGVLDGDDGV